jgi:hypothetical protein
MEEPSNPWRNPASSLQQVPQETGQSGISKEIVTLAFGLSLGAIPIVTALASGLGGREAAGREPENMVDAFKGEDVE